MVGVVKARLGRSAIDVDQRAEDGDRDGDDGDGAFGSAKDQEVDAVDY